MYDYWLGGKDNYVADRAAGDAALEAYPDLVSSVRANRAYLSRVVRYLAGQAGIRQFLDIGTGIPTANNTHEVAQRLAPESRVVYVDNDPIVLAHARALLRQQQGGRDRLHRRRPPRHRHDPAAGEADARLLRPGGGHAHRGAAPDRRRRGPAGDRGQADATRSRPGATWRCRTWRRISSRRRWPR